jgi:isoleucyl-tRNA synthetase
MYAGEDVKDFSEIKIENILDKWILAKLKFTKDKITSSLDNYDLMVAGREYGEFINQLSTWYVRRSRDRFKLEENEDKVHALTVLRYVLLETTKLIAPYAPFMADGIYLKLKKSDDLESVHLNSWPEIDLEIDDTVLENMEKLRALVEEGLAIRSTNTIKIRQALATVELKGCDLPEEYLEILKDELNVKEVKVVDEFSSGENWVASEKVAMDLEITEELRKEGIGREMVRFINMTRKNARLTVNDIASVKYWTEDEFIKNAVSEQDDYLKLNTRSKEINFADDSLKDEVKKVKVNGVEVWIVVG